jgi:hypothetical protein
LRRVTSKVQAHLSPKSHLRIEEIQIMITIRPTVTPFPDMRTTGWPFNFTNMTQEVNIKPYPIVADDWLATDLTYFSGAGGGGISNWADLVDWMATNAPQLTYGGYFSCRFGATRAAQDAERANSAALYNNEPRIDGYYPVYTDDLPADCIQASPGPAAYPNSFYLDVTKDATQRLFCNLTVRRLLENGLPHGLSDEWENATQIAFLERMGQAHHSCGLRFVPNLGAWKNFLTTDEVIRRIGAAAEAATFEMESVSGTEVERQVPLGSQSELADFMDKLEKLAKTGCLVILLPRFSTISNFVNLDLPFYTALALMLERASVGRSLDFDVPASADWISQLGRRVGPINVSSGLVIGCEFENGELEADATTRVVTLNV